jgi:glycosyltransferase involved in cell wall biosynthesis
VGRADPFVSVVVPVRNGERTLPACLASLLAVDFPPSRREIIVVDNGSSDGTAAILDGAPVRRLHEGRRGASRARNAGIVASRGEIVAFTDADCVVSREWLRRLVEPLAEAKVEGVAGEIVAYPPATTAERYAARIRHLAPQKYLRRPILPFAVFANLAFRRGVFDRVGLLDEAMTAGESTDFCTRFRRSSQSGLVYAPRAVVFHRHRRTAAALFRQQWNYGRGHALLYIKYAPEIPWGWRQSALAYADLGKAILALGTSALRLGVGPGRRDEVAFRYLDCVRKVAERLGFARQALAKGRFYL